MGMMPKKKKKEEGKMCISGDTEQLQANFSLVFNLAYCSSWGHK